MQKILRFKSEIARIKKLKVKMRPGLSEDLNWRIFI